MKNQNNPVVIGALLVVLGGAVVVIVRTVMPQGEATVVSNVKAGNGMQPANGAAPVAAVSAAADTGPLRLERDPFFHSDIQRIAALDEKLIHVPNAPLSPAGDDFQTDGGYEGLSASGGALTATSAAKGASKPTVKSAAPKKPSVPAPPDPAIAENALAGQLRLTAVLGGNWPRAIIEGFNAQPTVVRMGDAIGMLRVVAIRAQEIVLSGTSGLWTIPLQSAAPAAAPDQPTPTEDAKTGTPDKQDRKL